MKIAVAITYWHSPDRIKYLEHILENTIELGAETIYLCSNINIKVCGVSSISFKNLRHGYHLAWKHKKLFRLLHHINPHDYYIYLEDDLGFNQSNFQYWLTYKDKLKPHRLIPSMLRYEEYNGDFWTIDVRRHISGGPSLTISDTTFYAFHQPYQAMYIMDSSDMSHHLNNESSNLERSRQQCRWEIRERAAMGLTWDSPIAPFAARPVIPFRNNQVVKECLIHHLPNNKVGCTTDSRIQFFRLTNLL